MSTRTARTLATILGAVALAIIAVLIAAQTPEGNGPLAEVGGEVITSQEVRDALGQDLARLEEQLYNLKRQKLDELIEEKLLQREAARRGTTKDELLEEEVNRKLDPLSDDEVEVLFEINKDRFKGDAEELRRQIRAYLTERQQQERRQVFVQSLRAEADVAIHLKLPEPYRAQVATEGAPFRGSASAPVTIVKFEDFHCPYCRRVQTTLSQLLLRYGERLKVVHRDFPLDSLHPMARPSHVAARCAGEQGQFWAYHDALFANPPTADSKDFTTYAEEVGLDMDAFESCLQSGAFQEAIQKDVDDGLKLGLTGTPAFFINGRLLNGALPLADFVKIIDEELGEAN